MIWWRRMKWRNRPTQAFGCRMKIMHPNAEILRMQRRMTREYWNVYRIRICTGSGYRYRLWGDFRVNNWFQMKSNINKIMSLESASLIDLICLCGTYFVNKYDIMIIAPVDNSKWEASTKLCFCNYKINDEMKMGKMGDRKAMRLFAPCQ